MKVKMHLSETPENGDRYGNTIAEFSLDAENLVALAVYQEALAKLTTGKIHREYSVSNPENLEL